MCKPNPNRLKISSGSFESHHWQMRPSFEVRDVETQVVDRHDVQVEFATTPVRFEKPEPRLESRYNGCDNIARDFARRPPPKRLMWPNGIVPSAIGEQLLPKIVNPKGYQDAPCSKPGRKHSDANGQSRAEFSVLQAKLHEFAQPPLATGEQQPPRKYATHDTPHE